MNAESQREAIFARLSGNKSGLCLCPAHNDKNPSLHVSVSNGKLLLRCHAGCAQEDVLAALTELGLWAQPEPKTGNGHGFDYALRTEGKPIATWPYVNQNGNTLFVIARYAQTNGHKSFRPWTYKDGKWECKRFVGKYPLFRLNAISSNDLPVVVVEGEKCAIALDSLLGGKYCVTTWAGGAQAVNNTDWGPLGKRKVIVWPDADTPGAGACEAICKLLPHSSALRVDDRVDGWDCADAIAEGWTADDLDEFIQERLIPAEPANEPETGKIQTQVKPHEPINWAHLANKDPPKREWIIEDWLPNSPCLLSGAGGVGKSILVQAVATSISVGINYIGNVGEPKRVLVWLCEDSEEEIWRRQTAICEHFDIKLDELTNLFIVVRSGLDNALVAPAMGGIALAPAFGQLSEQVGDLKPDFTILDNTSHVFGGNENSRYDVTFFINQLVGIFRDKQLAPAFQVVGHVSKQPSSEYSGSTAWENSVRMRLFFGFRMPDDNNDDDDIEDKSSDIRFLSKRKTNYTKLDYKQMNWVEKTHSGLFVPSAEEVEESQLMRSIRVSRCESEVLAGIINLGKQGLYANESSASPNYLPKFLRKWNIINKRDFTDKEVLNALANLLFKGKIMCGDVGAYGNRTKKFGIKAV